MCDEVQNYDNGHLQNKPLSYFITPAAVERSFPDNRRT
jgi:hypothetical protein